MNHAILFMLLLPGMTYLDTTVKVSEEENSILAEYYFEFTAGVGRQKMVAELSRLSTETSKVDRTLKYIEVYSMTPTQWTVMHRYEVGLAFIRDRTEMVMRYSRDSRGDVDYLRWTLVESLDGKILNSDGRWEIYDDPAGSRIVYTSKTRYNGKPALVAFALENFSEGLVKATLNRTVKSASVE